MKDLLTSVPILKIVDPNEDILVCIDTCKGLGGALAQGGHVISYESRKLKEHEISYATHDLEHSFKTLNGLQISHLTNRVFKSN